MMKKIYRFTSVLATLALAVFAFAGYAGVKNASAGADCVMDISEVGTRFTKYADLAATIENYAAAAPIDTEPVLDFEGTNVFTDKTVFAKGDGAQDDTDAFREGLKYASAVAGGTFVITRPLFITESVIIPDGITLGFTGSGKLVLDERVTVYLGNGCKIAAGRTRIFDGAGKVAGGDYDIVAKPEWFGAPVNTGEDSSPAVQAALGIAGTVNFDAGTYSLRTTITLPTDHDVRIEGAGPRSTWFITYVGSGSAVFVMNKADAVARKVVFTDFRADETGNNRLTDLISINGCGAVEVEVTHNYLYGYRNAVNLTNVELATLGYGYASGNANVFRLDDCSNVSFYAFLGTGNQHLMTVTDSQDIKLMHTSEVWGYGTDVDFEDCTGVEIIAGGFDLGYTLLSGTSKPYGENPYAIRLAGCDNVLVKDMWVATNGGASYMTTETVAVPSDRTGIYIDACTGVSVEFSTITNHSTGLRIVNAPANSGITVTGNQFVGNEDCNAVLSSSQNVTFMVNCFTQSMQNYTAADISGNNCQNILFAGDTFRKQTSLSSLQNSFTNSTNIVFDSPTFF